MTAIALLVTVALLVGTATMYVRSQRRLHESEQQRVRLEERLRLATTAAEEERCRRDEDAERFRHIASDIMAAQASDMRHRNEERLQQVLAPLKADIERFSATVGQCYADEARERFSLQQAIRTLVETNQNIGREARELSQALRGNNRRQGQWGEIVLQTILEKSGLREGHEFTTQASHDTGTDEGERLRLRPDVVVHYPDRRCIIIDSKASLTAFIELTEARDDDERKLAARRHVESVRRHVDMLGAKHYENLAGDETLDFVMMFIPNEAAYLAAMQHDADLWQRAYDKRVLIVSPTHLISALRLISQLWVRDKQTRNTIEIAEAAGRMYDKFSDFVKDLNKIGASLGAAQRAYDAAVNKLSDGKGSLMSRAEKLQEMGAKVSKQLRKE
ncbi:DNA recombination protein RmuC [Paramuribaculum intestinale]|uniref:DNA recombination protein RmuC n=2 Tax=Paramuribaculum intestinale TaxID=2094151 RepID=UPI0025A5B85C|nr:DNA recombination protein RmuC [Paramuribaculum intestinale]